LKKTIFSICLAISLIWPGWIEAQEEGASYLDAVIRRFSSLNDYSVDVKVHFDIEALKTPDMEGRLYYKAPDKMKIESKRIFFFPREGGYFNPAAFRPENFEVSLLEHLTEEGKKAVRLRLIPKKARWPGQGLILTIDTEQDLIKEIDTSPFGGREIKASIEYGRFDQFDLPTRIRLQLDIPSIEMKGTRSFDPSVQRTKRIKGKVEIAYSNYRINTGLSEEIFQEKEPVRQK
jgi:hypothetical protein